MSEMFEPGVRGTGPGFGPGVRGTGPGFGPGVRGTGPGFGPGVRGTGPGFGAGQLVAGLRLVRLVGSGGEGQVWEARDHAGRRRALKLIRPELLASPAQLAERGRHLTRIDHRCLVKVHRTGRLHTGDLDGWGFVEMDFVEGESLADAEADPGILNRLEPLAEALDLLHDGEWSDGMPLVHRDIKPANLIQTPDGTIVLVDCSTLRGADTTQITRVGTPVFAAPEVITGRLGPPADVYSFAVTLVALVTGARGDELAELLDDPESLELGDALIDALSPSPGERPASCLEVLADTEEGAIAGAGGWGWLSALGLVAAATVIALVGPGEWRLPAALAAGGIHVAAHLVAGRWTLLAFLMPPVAWALLLADEAAITDRAEAWLRAALLGVLVTATAATVLTALGSGSARSLVGLVVCGWAFSAAAMVTLALRGAAVPLARLLLLPAWLAGVVMICFGTLLALPVVLAGGAGGEAARLVGRTLASAAIFVRRLA